MIDSVKRGVVTKTAEAIPEILGDAIGGMTEVVLGGQPLLIKEQYRDYRRHHLRRNLCGSVFAGRSGRISLQTGGGGDPAGIGSADCRLHFWNRQRVSASAEDNLYDGITVSTDDRDRHSIDHLMHLKERKMTEGLYQWVENIAFYMVLMTAALHFDPR